MPGRGHLLLYKILKSTQKKNPKNSWLKIILRDNKSTHVVPCHVGVSIYLASDCQREATPKWLPCPSLFLSFCRAQLDTSLKSELNTTYYLRGGSVLKNKDIGVNNHYFIRGYYFQIFFHMLSLCKFLLWVNRKGGCITYNSRLPIIPYPIVS